MGRVGCRWKATQELSAVCGGRHGKQHRRCPIQFSAGYLISSRLGENQPARHATPHLPGRLTRCRIVSFLIVLINLIRDASFLTIAKAPSCVSIRHIGCHALVNLHQPRFLSLHD